MAKKNPSIFATLQKTAESASAVNGELVRTLPVDALEDNPLNRFSMEEDEQFLATVASVEKYGFLEDIIVTPPERAAGALSAGTGGPPPPEGWAKPPSPARSGPIRTSSASSGP